ncbi:hypothetical protein Tco_1501153 [Tanacetum coccineum]
MTDSEDDDGSPNHMDGDGGSHHMEGDGSPDHMEGDGGGHHFNSDQEEYSIPDQKDTKDDDGSPDHMEGDGGSHHMEGDGSLDHMEGDGGSHHFNSDQEEDSIPDQEGDDRYDASQYSPKSADDMTHFEGDEMTHFAGDDRYDSSQSAPTSADEDSEKMLFDGKSSLDVAMWEKEMLFDSPIRLTKLNTDPIASWDGVSAHKPVGTGLHSQANDQAVITNPVPGSNWVNTLRRKLVYPIGQAEVANKEILKGVEKRMKKYKTCWVNELSIANHV